MRVVVFAYHEIGYACLEELIDFGADVLCLFTHKDDEKEELWFRRPAALAERYAIPVHKPESLKQGHWTEIIRGLKPDIIFSFYYRNMIPVEILEIPEIGAFNLHGSLLPRFRGRCPVNWVLIEGEKETGVTLHYMVAKPDAGNIVAQRRIEITFEDTARTVFMKMAEAARLLIREMLPQFRDRTFSATPQTGPSSYYGGRRPEDGIISWSSDARTIYNLTRAVTHPYPGAFTFIDGRRLFIWKAYPEDGSFGDDAAPGTVVSTKPLRVTTGRGLLRLESMQLDGEDEMDGAAFAALHVIESRVLGG